jgi:Dyp-type peroxidase family
MPYVPQRTPTRQFASLVFAKVAKEHVELLRSLLGDIRRETVATMRGAPPASGRARPIVPFAAIESIHYARFVLLERDVEGEPWLAFSTDYDGPEGDASCSRSRAFDLHVRELVTKAGEGLERVFACCEGYRPGGLEKFLRRKQRKASTSYTGSSGRSRNQILWERDLRREVDRILDAGGFEHTKPDEVRRAVQARLDGRYKPEQEVPRFPPQPDLTGRIALLKGIGGAVAILLLCAIASIGFYSVPLVLSCVALILATIGMVVWRFRRLELTDPQFQPEFSDRTRQEFEVASADENEFLQNQLTHLVAVKPGVLRWLLIRLVFAVLDVLAANLYNKGKLGGIPSIHFARWVMIPGRGVLFLSNFDSSWQSYLGDFIDQASAGLTAVWSNTVRYPRTTWLLTAGSRDASRFLAWTRAHQHPTHVWYAAYPGLSIVNVNTNTEIRRGLADPDCMDAATWLFHLRGVARLEADRLFGDERKQLPLAVKDIQGIILWGYGHAPEARYLMLRVRRAREAARWLSGLELTSAAGSRNDEPKPPLVNVAFSYRGLCALDVDPELRERFSVPFVQGSDHPYRARLNGDVGDDDPARWEWGSNENWVHVVLLVYAETPESVTRHADELVAMAQQHGLELVTSLEGTTLAGRKEHFGFRDGIAQPTVKGSGRGEIEGNMVAAGEFLLGHRDGYDNVSHSPKSAAGFDFGRNGSYLVFRQLEQDVEAFWRFCVEHGDGDPIKMASKLVGRWPSGAPLVRHPDRDPNVARFADEDTFTYLANDDDNDRYGARCPFGAHIRRTNPRDWQLGETPEESLEFANLHRILRRGRPYGKALDPAMQADALVERSGAQRGGAPGARARRGLQFLCFNANIDRQFEFVQQQWSNNPKFAGQDADADPLLGMHQAPAAMGTNPPVFTRQSDVKTGVCTRATGMQRFVRVVGSTYFFMPSIPAVKLLGTALSQPSAPRVQALEQVPDDEQLHIDSLIDTLRDKMKRDYAGGKTLRDAHPKMHGCVRATLTVARDLPPELAVGVFRAPRTYKAWVRFSNASGEISPDKKPDIRGVAIKLLDVPGPKLLEGFEDCRTHDFVLISSDAFVTKDVSEFDALVRAMVGGTWRFGAFLLTHPRVAQNLFTALRVHTSLLDVRYFSVAPYLFGSEAVKYSLQPSAPRVNVRSRPGPDFLREALKAELEAGAATFDFLVQQRVDADTAPHMTPIEDPRVAWREPHARLRKVATLELLQEDFDTPERREFGENLSFNPWRCLAEHRPLGGISRARRQVYRTLSGYRHDRNAAPVEEPTGDHW